METATVDLHVDTLTKEEYRSVNQLGCDLFHVMKKEKAEVKVVIQACDVHKLFLNWVIECPQNQFTPGYLISPLVIVCTLRSDNHHNLIIGIHYFNIG